MFYTNNSQGIYKRPIDRYIFDAIFMLIPSFLVGSTCLSNIGFVLVRYAIDKSHCLYIYSRCKYNVNFKYAFKYSLI